MANMSLGEGMAALKQAIADHVAGTQGSQVHAASIADILAVLASGPKTLAAIQTLVDDISDEYVAP